MGSLNHMMHRNGRPVQPLPSASRGLGDRERRFNRSRDYFEDGDDRRNRREREDEGNLETGRYRQRRGRRIRDEEDEERERNNHARDESESDYDKKDLEDSEEEEEEEEEEEDSFEDEEEEEERGAVGREPYQNEDFGSQRVALPGMGRDGERRARSRDDLYQNQDFPPPAAKSKSLSSFNQPEENTTAHIYLPKRSDLPPPPPTPAKPQVGPKPSARPPSHPAFRNVQQSSVPSERSDSGRPSPVPRKSMGSSLGSDQSLERGYPPYGNEDYRRNPAYGNEDYGGGSERGGRPYGGNDYYQKARPLPSKVALGAGSQEFLPSSHQTSFHDDESELAGYKPRTPPMNPYGHLPNLPRYSPPLPMERPPSYEETEIKPRGPTGGYMPSSTYRPPPSDYRPPHSEYLPFQDAPEPDVQYMPRRQPDPVGRGRMSSSRENLSSSREELSRSREQLSRSREQLSRSREQLSRSRERVDIPSPYTPNVLYLNRSGAGAGDISMSSSHTETEI
jgi:hypothetical protein